MTSTFDTTTTTITAADDRRRWIALVVVCMAMLMNVLDTSIVNVALPAIQKDLGFTQANLAWVIDGYLITFGSFLLMAGRFGDLIGRKRVFLAGVAIFTVASALCALADTQGLLIAARFLQGFGGAVSSSVIIALIITEFPRPDERAKAMSAYILVSVGGGSAGLLLGGVLTEALNWHWIFAINLPIGVATILLGRRLLVADSGAGLGGGVDVLGSVLVTAALMTGIYAIIKVPEHGWGSLHTIGIGAVAIALMAGFFVLESRIANPIMPLRIFRVPGLLWSSAMRGCITAGMYSVFFLSALYLEHVRGFGPVDTGLAFLPMTLAVSGMSAGVTSRLIGRFGARRLVPGGMVFVIAALLLLANAGTDTPYAPSMLIAFLLMGLGISTALLPLLTIAMENVPGVDAGLGSGIVNVSSQISAALGLAIFGTIAANHTRALRGDGQPLNEALTNGYQVAYVVAAVLVSVGLLFVLIKLHLERRRRLAESAEPVAA
ncbi:MAG TPA: MFS transporter [Solirubrobacteraceae bacterium]|nr:MFS transporter [Solirubrobacteraceae bacterium]